jgi:hypothetical protein
MPSRDQEHLPLYPRMSKTGISPTPDDRAPSCRRTVPHLCHPHRRCRWDPPPHTRGPSPQRPKPHACPSCGVCRISGTWLRPGHHRIGGPPRRPVQGHAVSLFRHQGSAVRSRDAAPHRLGHAGAAVQPHAGQRAWAPSCCARSPGHGRDRQQRPRHRTPGDCRRAGISQLAQMYRRTAHEPLVARIRGLAELAQSRGELKEPACWTTPSCCWARCGWP